MKNQEFKHISFFWPSTMQGIGFAFVNREPYEDSYLFMYSKKPNNMFSLEKCSEEAIDLMYNLLDFAETIDKVEEWNCMLDGLETKDLVTYSTILAEHDLIDYQITSILICKSSVDYIRNFFHKFIKEDIEDPRYSKIFSPKLYIKDKLNDEDKVINKPCCYHSESNEDKMTVYIILRSDLDRSVAEQMCDTALLMEKLTENEDFYEFKNEWDDQVVILQAQYDDLFVNNFIPVEPSDKRLIFATTISNCNRVAHGNFRLSEAQINGIAYMGKKCNMPKYVRKLQTWR